jgi:hypothetical protein
VNKVVFSCGDVHRQIFLHWLIRLTNRRHEVEDQGMIQLPENVATLLRISEVELWLLIVLAGEKTTIRIEKVAQLEKILNKRVKLMMTSDNH